MQAWHQKAVRDGFKMLVPFPRMVRKLVRAVRPYQSNPDNDRGLVADVLMQLRTLAAFGVPIANAVVVEIGTGWKPVLPLLYGRHDAARIITVDQERLLDANTFRDTVRLIQADAMRHPGAYPFQPWAYDDHDIGAMDLSELLALGRIAYGAPADFRDLPTDSTNIIVSRDVLEHVPEPLLVDMLKASTRILKDGGVICHTIDMSDHWEHKDKSISRVNFLRYDRPWWTLAGINPQNYQNRLRRYEFIELIKAAGFEILMADGAPDAGALAALRKMRVCPRYASAPHEELAILQTTIVARKRPQVYMTDAGFPVGIPTPTQ